MGILSSLTRIFVREGIKKAIDDSQKDPGEAYLNGGNSADSSSPDYTSAGFKSATIAYNRQGCYSMPITEENRRDYEPGIRNLYDYVGDPVAYFREVIRDNFSDYEIRENVKLSPRTHATVEFMLMKDERICAVVEVIKPGSSRYANAGYCAKNRIPYARFHIGHEGWWNMEPYVVSRIRSAMR